MRIQFLPDGSLFVLIVTNKVVIKKTLIGASGLNLPEVGKLLVPSIPVKLSHMDISVEI